MTTPTCPIVFFLFQTLKNRSVTIDLATSKSAGGLICNLIVARKWQRW